MYHSKDTPAGGNGASCGDLGSGNPARLNEKGIFARYKRCLTKIVIPALCHFHTFKHSKSLMKIAVPTLCHFMHSVAGRPGEAGEWGQGGGGVQWRGGGGGGTGAGRGTGSRTAVGWLQVRAGVPSGCW